MEKLNWHYSYFCLHKSIHEATDNELLILTFKFKCLLRGLLHLHKLKLYNKTWKALVSCFASIIIFGIIGLEKGYFFCVCEYSQRR